MKTNPHKESGLARKCSANDLFLVREGLQCGNCLVLVQDDRTDEQLRNILNIHHVQINKLKEQIAVLENECSKLKEALQ